MHRYRPITLPIVLVTLLTGCSRVPEAPPLPNVLLIVMDTTRSDHCSVYGYARETTPNLEAFAQQGVRFEQAYAPMGITGPSHASLFTSKYTVSHGLVKNGLKLADEFTTMAEFLAARGYQTAAFVSSFVLDRRFGLNQGFEHYDDALDPAETTFELDQWEGHEVSDGFDRRGEFTTQRVVEWLNTERDPARPFFLFAHYFDPHTPYTAPPPFDTTYFAEVREGNEVDAFIADYDAEIRYTDHVIGRLLDRLDAMNLADNTIVIVTADHGEGLMQRGYLLHGLSLYEEEVHVPLIFRWKDRITGARVVKEPVELVDVFPTVVGLLGFSAPDGLFQGRSLADSLIDHAPLDPMRPVYLHRRPFGLAGAVANSGADGKTAVVQYPVRGEQFGMREGKWKYVIGPDEGRQDLFDLESDPGELVNRYEARPDIGKDMRERLERWVGAHRSARPIEDTVLEEDRARLRALGYID